MEKKFWDFNVVGIQDGDKCTVRLTTSSGKVYEREGALPIANLIRILGGKYGKEIQTR